MTKHGRHIRTVHMYVAAENTHLLCKGSITVQLTPCLTGFELAKQVNLFLILTFFSMKLNPKQTGGQPYSDTSSYKLKEYCLTASFSGIEPRWNLCLKKKVAARHCICYWLEWIKWNSCSVLWNENRNRLPAGACCTNLNEVKKRQNLSPKSFVQRHPFAVA